MLTNLAGKVTEPGPEETRSSKLSKKRTRLTETGLLAYFDTRELTADEQEVADGKLFRFLAVCGIAFNVVESPFFLDFMQFLRPNYVPAGARCVLGYDIHLAECLDLLL